MDLGIAGKRAIICGASKGLGKACAEALAREGVKITIAARHLAQLAETAEEIRKATGSRVTAVVADVKKRSPHPLVRFRRRLWKFRRW